jgi:hypothetical protein
MLYLVTHPLKRPAEKQLDLLLATLDLYGIEYQRTAIEKIPAGSTVITDCFVMETPYGDPGHDIATRLIEHSTGRDCKLIFYYPSESYATLSASFCPTANLCLEHSIEAHLIKCGDWNIIGFTNHNLPEFFAWIINNDFNRARLAYTQHAIDTKPKTHQFLFLNGERRQDREYFFNLYKEDGWLNKSIWSYRSGKSADGFGPNEDWLDPFCHPDFRFYAYYPSHFYRTEVSIIAETTQMEFFPTEKTYKSLMLGHPFILFGGRCSLKELHKLGFQTFGEWIDEGYDLTDYPLERADYIVQKTLASVPENITELSAEVREHNRRQFGYVANSTYLKLLNILQSIDRSVIINESFAITDATLQKYFLN